MPKKPPPKRRIIVNVRGTHGSGKSTIVRNIMDKYGAVAIQGPVQYTVKGTPRKQKPHGYMCRHTPFGDLYIVGSYETACGGCDGIQPYAEIWPRVEDYAYHGHVLFEGALVSNSYGNIGRASEQYGDDFVFAFLDTPLDVCIDRIVQRREERGNTKPFDPNKSVVRIHTSNERVLEKVRDEFHRRYVVLDHKDATNQVIKLFKGSKWVSAEA